MAKKITEEVKKRVFELRKEDMSELEIARELGIGKTTVGHILNNKYEAGLKQWSEQAKKLITYKLSPFPILDIIIEKKEASLSVIAEKLGYISQTPNYFSLAMTLGKLSKDRILIQKGDGGRSDPFRYSINTKHPQYDTLNAMCDGMFEERSETSKDWID